VGHFVLEDVLPVLAVPGQLKLLVVLDQQSDGRLSPLTITPVSVTFVFQPKPAA
jgi:hypothetical protein